MSERITGHTELIGLIAKPIKHSSSPKMHNEAFGKIGLDYAYLAFEVDEENLEDAVKGLKALGARGWNVSMPYKKAIIKYLDKLTPAAEMCEAVNTVINDNGVLTGTITDGTGFMMGLKDAGIDPIGKKMTIVGAGGAATAVAIQAALDGVKEISIFNIKDKFYENGEHTVRKINENTNCKATIYELDNDKLKEEIESSYLLLNATGVGMKPLEGQTWLPDVACLRSDLICVDTIYSPLKTKFLEMAESVGCKTLNGLPMLLYQGAAAFKLWTGKDMPIEHVKDVMGFKF